MKEQLSEIKLLFQNIQTSPEDKILFIYSRKPSSLISLSVNRKVIPVPWCPAVRYKYFRSSSRLVTLYDLVKKLINIMKFFPINPFKIP